jgi:hypothetical protein
VSESHTDTPLISIIIVNYRVPDFTCQALRSLRDAELFDRSEVIVVDNASGDESRGLIMGNFPDVTWIALKNNVGFGKASNVGALNARGTYLLFLNPDTLVTSNTLKVCTDFLAERPDVGMMGPKILNPDGSFQPSCRRSFPTPFDAFSHFAGLSALFPKSKRFGKYNFTFMDPNVSMEVDAVSGSFMMMRREVFEEIGGFDKAFFMYGEDLDICARIKQKGLRVWYLPTTQIVHFKGKSSAKQHLRSRFAFYEAMILFSRKYRHTYGTFFPGWLVALGIVIQAGVNLAGSLFRTSGAVFIDFLFINTVLWAGLSIRFRLGHITGPYQAGQLSTMLALHLLMTGLFLLTFAYRGVYTRERYSALSALVSGVIASMMFLTVLYFVKRLAFSRIAFAVSALVITLMLPAWREILPRIARGFKRLLYTTGNVIIVGNSAVTSQLIHATELDKTAHISGIVWPGRANMPGQFEGYPVLGSIDTLGSILERQKTNLLLIATAEPWYSHVISALSSARMRHLTIKWVPHELLGEDTTNLPEMVPLRDFSV